MSEPSALETAARELLERYEESRSKRYTSARHMFAAFQALRAALDAEPVGEVTTSKCIDHAVELLECLAYDHADEPENVADSFAAIERFRSEAHAAGRAEVGEVKGSPGWLIEKLQDPEFFAEFTAELRRDAHAAGRAERDAEVLEMVAERYDEPSVVGVAFADEYEKHCDQWRGNKHFGPCEQHQSLAAHFDAHVRELVSRKAPDGKD